MKTLRRFDIKNTYYFITNVTFKREPLLHLNIDLFWSSWSGIPLEAWVIMADHFHLIIKIDEISISKIMHSFKTTYSLEFRSQHRPGRVWQNRFWDHIIRDQKDMNNHIDYIHFNPVDHGLIKDPFKYKHSSLIKYYEDGKYERNWGMTSEIEFNGDYGE